MNFVLYQASSIKDELVLREYTLATQVGGEGAKPRSRFRYMSLRIYGNRQPSYGL